MIQQAGRATYDKGPFDNLFWRKLYKFMCVTQKDLRTFLRNTNLTGGGRVQSTQDGRSPAFSARETRGGRASFGRRSNAIAPTVLFQTGPHEG